MNSRQSDSRGRIERYEVDGARFHVLFTKAGAYRSGDMHPNTQYDLILKGEFEITLKKKKADVKVKTGPNELIVIPPNTPHLFKSITDTVMIEWWDGPFEATYYEPYRRIVEEQLLLRHEASCKL